LRHAGLVVDGFRHEGSHFLSTGKGNSFRVMGIIGAKLEILSADGE
jgi:hypothetical protein